MGAIKSKGIAGEVTYAPEHFPPYEVEIKIDANHQPIVHYIIHELLHVVYSPFLTGIMDDSLEEAVIVGLDAYMFNYVKASRSRLAKWNALIEKKLAESAAALPDTPLEELVDRS